MKGSSSINNRDLAAQDFCQSALAKVLDILLFQQQPRKTYLHFLSCTFLLLNFPEQEGMEPYFVGEASDP